MEGKPLLGHDRAQSMFNRNFVPQAHTQTDPHVLAACAYPSNLSTVIDCVILCL